MEDSTANNPLVLHVTSFEFSPSINITRRKLTVDVEIPYSDIEELIVKLTERTKFQIRTPVRIRFIGNPV